VAQHAVILVDSDILIAHLRGVGPAREWLTEARTTTGPLAVSVVCVAEITGGMRSAERREVWRLLGRLRKQPVDELTARRAGEFMRIHHRSHQGIGLGDYLVAATADVRGLELVTLNVKHFPMFKGLRPPFRLV
jgi:predicted nucleic acid-binding protein